MRVGNDAIVGYNKMAKVLDSSPFATCNYLKSYSICFANYEYGNSYDIPTSYNSTVFTNLLVRFQALYLRGCRMAMLGNIWLAARTLLRFRISYHWCAIQPVSILCVGLIRQ